MLTINFSKQAEKFLRRVPAKHAKQIIGRIRNLANNPDSTQTVELKGYEPIKRLRSGEYRVLFVIEGNMLEIFIVGKRNDDKVYKHLRRFLR